MRSTARDSPASPAGGRSAASRGSMKPCASLRVDDAARARQRAVAGRTRSARGEPIDDAVVDGADAQLHPRTLRAAV